MDIDSHKRQPSTNSRYYTLKYPNNHNWNEPENLFIEIDTFFSSFTAMHTFLKYYFEDFISDHPSFNSTVRNTGNLLALFFNVKVSGETTDTDKHDPYYLNKFVGFNQPILGD